MGILYNTTKISRRTLEENGYGVLFGQGSTISNGPLSANKSRIRLKASLRDTVVAASLFVNRATIIAETDPVAMLADIFNTINLKGGTNLKGGATMIASMKSEIEKVSKRAPGNANDKNICGFETDDGKEDMITKIEEQQAWLSLAWSGDAVYAMEENEDLDYYVPDEGGNLWVDAWVINKKSKNTEAAHIWIDWLLNPDVALKNMNEIGYRSAVSKEVMMKSGLICTVADGEPVYDEDGELVYRQGYEGFFENEVRYPTAEVIARSAPLRRFDPALDEDLNDMWEIILKR